VQIASLADQKEEMESALKSQAELTAEVALLQQEYDEVLGKARRALELQEELPKLQVRRVAGPCWGGLRVPQLPASTAHLFIPQVSSRANTLKADKLGARWGAALVAARQLRQPSCSTDNSLGLLLSTSRMHG
jgi:hypothetical protein